MNTDIARDYFKDMNIVAAGLANNHSHDFGEQGFEESRGSLSGLGVRALTNGIVSDFSSFRLLPLLLLPRKGDEQDWRNSVLDQACKTTAAPPLIVMVHWGTEYTSALGPDEADVARRLSACGVTAVIGAHSHQASAAVTNVSGRTQTVFSLGNFIFDQNGARGSGALLELRLFKDGNVALRLIPIPNFFDLANKAIQRKL